MSRTGAPKVVVNIANALDKSIYEVAIYNVNSSARQLDGEVGKDIRLTEYYPVISKGKASDNLLIKYDQKIDLVLKPDDSIQFMDTEIEFLGIEVVADQNFDSVVGNFQITTNDNVYQLTSEKRVYKIGGVITSETGIKSLINRDFLIVLGDRFNDGSWSLRYSIKYGIMLIWLSSISLIFSMLYGVVRRYE